MPTYENQLQAAFDAEAFRAEGKRVVDLLADHLAASNPEGRPRVLPYEDPEAMLAAWADRFGRAPAVPFPELLPEILARSNDLLHPRFVGHQCTTALPLAALAGFAGQFLNNGTAVYEMGPVNTAMERQLVRWMAGLAGWGPDADGVLTSGGSIGNLTALLAARQAAAERDVWREGVGGDAAAGGPRLASNAITASGGRSPSWAWARRRRARGRRRALPHDPGGSGAGLRRGRAPRPPALRRRGQRLLDGHRQLRRPGDGRPISPRAAACGSTSTGPTAPGALLSAKYRHLLQGLERADSFIWDAHKNMLMPALITAVLFRDGRRSYEAFSQKASYLFEKEAPRGVVQLRPPHPRMHQDDDGDAAVRLAGRLRHGFLRRLRHGHVGPGPRLRRRLMRDAGDFEVAVEPESNIVCFRYLKPGETDARRPAAPHPAHPARARERSTSSRPSSRDAPGSAAR